jgi:hypothetical protein
MDPTWLSPTARTGLRGWRAVGLLLALLASAAILLWRLDHHDPVEGWLFLRLATCWAFALLLAACWLSSGFAVLRWLLPQGVPLRERLVLSVPVGVLVFFLGMFLGGLLHLYGAAFAVALPALLLVSGLRPLLRTGRRAWYHLRRARARRPAPGVAANAALLFGLLGLGLVYFTALTPENVAYDARWYHLAIAEHYAALGGITRSPEGWVQIALPHLASVLYTWPYLFPGLSLFTQIEAAAHIELALFAWTLACVPLVVRWLVPGARARRAWVVFFLFPAVLVYDSNLNVGADHIAAFWSLPMLLALRRALPRLEARPCGLLAITVAGALLTKYQMAPVVMVVALAVTGRALWLARRNPRALAGAGVVAGAVLLLTTPHWLKNWIWYGDPIYPLLHKHLAVRPWHADKDQLFVAMSKVHLWQPVGTLGEKLRETLVALATFSFKHHNWGGRHGDWPVFGFLFTLSWLVMPFVRAGRRVWWLFAGTHLAVFAWYWMSHQERYLQAIMPWAVVHVAAVLALIWRAGLAARAALVPVLALQVIWGISVYFIPSHALVGSPHKLALDLLSGGFRRDPNRYQAFADFSKHAPTLPRRAKVLVHQCEIHAGLRRATVQDAPIWTGLISYGRMPSARAVHDLYRSLGITHVLWRSGGDTAREDSLAGDLRFFGAATWATHSAVTHGGLPVTIAPLVEAPPADDLNDDVAYLGCAGYARGRYALTALTVPGREVPPGTQYPLPAQPLLDLAPDRLEGLLGRVNYAVTSAACPGPIALPASVAGAFVLAARRQEEQLWVRRTPLRR